IARLNYLTDDPWNPAHRTSWFDRCLPRYDWLFSPRLANLDDLRRSGCSQVEYLPFAYCPELHFPESPSETEEEALAADLMFAGGADGDRVPLLAAAIEAGFDVALYGGYWGRYGATRSRARRHLGPQALRHAVAAAKVGLCLVRRANRDGHVMRTFEL